MHLMDFRRTEQFYWIVSCQQDFEPGGFEEKIRCRTTDVSICML